jgi:hypothetical protein
VRWRACWTGASHGIPPSSVVRSCVTALGHRSWFDNQGLLAVKDTQTGGYCLADNHQCLAVFRSITEDGSLESAVAAEARRHDVHRAQIRSDIEHIALSQYRKGLLRPTAATS